MKRENKLTEWLKSLYQNQSFTLSFAAADADFRRYFRATFADGKCLILMDAPPDKFNLDKFISVQKLFSKAVHVPNIYHLDLENGFMAIEDFGDSSLINLIQQQHADLTQQKNWLLSAITILINLQKATQAEKLPVYSAEILSQEMDLFTEWCIPYYYDYTLSSAQLKTWQAIKNNLITKIIQQPQVYVHRDYIIRNLMLLKDQTLGVIDFQDALLGPITYDIASLTRDAFVAWEEEFTLDLLIHFWEQAKANQLPVTANFDDFYKDYEWMGVQRHLKVAGIFTRLTHRDNKEKYYSEIPLFISYLRRTARRYNELKPLYRLLNEICGPDPEVVSGFSF